jgi:pimeloyl-ACP methyl ester carboxylesterase
MEPTITGLESNATMTLSVFMGHVSAGPEQNQRVVAEALRIPTGALQAYLRALTRDSMGGRQGQLRLPVLQLAAGRREADPAREATTLAQFGFKELPAFRIIHFPGAKHWIMWDAPEAFLVAVRAFEAGLGR